MNVTIKDRWMWLAVVTLVVTAVAFAGTTNFDTLALTPELSTDNALVVNNSSGTNKFVITGAGAVSSAGAFTGTGGVILTATSAPAQVTSTSVGLLWIPAAGADCSAEAGELYFFESASTGFTSTLDDGAIKCW